MRAALARRIAAVEARCAPVARRLAPIVRVEPGEAVADALMRYTGGQRGQAVLVVPHLMRDRADFAIRFKAQQVALIADAKSRPIVARKDAPPIAEPIPMKPVARSPYRFGMSPWRKNKCPL